MLRLRPERLRELSLLLVLAVAILIFSLLIDNYLGGSFFNRVTTSVAITAILAAGQTIVILTRNIDLSVGSIVGVTAYVTGEYLHDHPSLTPVLAVAYAVAHRRRPRPPQRRARRLRARALDHRHARHAGDLPHLADQPLQLARRSPPTGCRTGCSTSRTRRSSASASGTSARWSPARSCSSPCSSCCSAASSGAAGSTRSARTRTPRGRPRCRSQRVILVAFVASGALAGLAGFLFLSRFGTITVNAGSGLELQSVAAAVVGGVNIFGGSGTLFGSLLGALLINLLDLSLLRVPGLSEFWRRRRPRRADPDRGRGRLPPRQADRKAGRTRAGTAGGRRATRAGGRPGCLTRRCGGAGSCSSRWSSSPSSA